MNALQESMTERAATTMRRRLETAGNMTDEGRAIENGNRIRGNLDRLIAYGIDTQLQEAHNQIGVLLEIVASQREALRLCEDVMRQSIDALEGVACIEELKRQRTRPGTSSTPALNQGITNGHAH